MTQPESETLQPEERSFDESFWTEYEKNPKFLGYACMIVLHKNFPDKTRLELDAIFRQAQGEKVVIPKPSKEFLDFEAKLQLCKSLKEIKKICDVQGLQFLSPDDKQRIDEALKTDDQLDFEDLQQEVAQDALYEQKKDDANFQKTLVEILCNRITALAFRSNDAGAEWPREAKLFYQDLLAQNFLNEHKLYEYCRKNKIKLPNEDELKYIRRLVV